MPTERNGSGSGRRSVVADFSPQSLGMRAGSWYRQPSRRVSRTLVVERRDMISPASHLHHIAPNPLDAIQTGALQAPGRMLEARCVVCNRFGWRYTGGSEPLTG